MSAFYFGLIGRVNSIDSDVTVLKDFNGQFSGGSSGQALVKTVGGFSWQRVAGTIIVSSGTPPATPIAGDAWLDPTDDPSFASLYELALANGFVGTSQQFIDSLKGTSATIQNPTIATGNPGTSATVVNNGTSSNAQYHFTIPRGDKGDTGDTGITVSTTAPANPQVNQLWLQID